MLQARTAPFSLLLLLCSIPVHAAAQAARRHSAFGFVAGVNIASLAGTDAAGTSSRVAFSIGGFYRMALDSTWSFQPELEYAGKGAQSKTGSATGTLDLRYLELPLLFRASAQSGPGLRLIGELGPAPALKVDCTLTGASGGASLSVPCSSVNGNVHSFDLGAIVGGGVELPLNTHSLTLVVRYNLGLTEIASGSDSKNRNLQFLGEFRM